MTEQTLAIIKQRIKYNPETGELSTINGKHVGSQRKDGYVYVGVNRERCMAHQIAWFLYYGEWPTFPMDHIDGQRNNNRIINLRNSSIRDNGLNRPEHRTGHVQGTTFNKKRGKWIAQIKLNGKHKWLGAYNTVEEAHDAYIKAREEYNV